jgi:hypothetical protein
MLTNTEYPVAWAMLLYELSDAHEHLGTLISEMIASGTIDESEYRIQLGHVFAHLNRAWNGRNDVSLEDSGKEMEPQEVYAQRSKFPDDLSPVG